MQAEFPVALGGDVWYDAPDENGFIMQGCVYLIGAGPGDPSLMTLKGRDLIGRADCIVYDALVSPEILSWAKEGCERIYVGKRASNHAMPQDEINRLLVEKSRKCACVVRLKGGDPYVFGRGGEEAEALVTDKVPFQVVPGISSAVAAAGYAGIPLTHRDYSSQFTVFTGHENPNKKESAIDWEGIARVQGTKVMLMGMSNLSERMESLISHGQDAATPAAAIQWAASGKQSSVCATVDTLAKAAEKQGIGAPAVVVIGDVVKLSKTLNWYERLPLFGKRVVVTRSREQASALSEKLRDLGADVLELPTIRIGDPEDKRTFAELVADTPHTYQWLIFTSPNGVKKYMEAFLAAHFDIRGLGGAYIAAIGPGTAEAINKYGLTVDVMPKKAVAEELIKEFQSDAVRERFRGIENCNVLWVRGNLARDVLYKGLMKMGAIVDECIAYSTLPETEDPTGARALLEAEGADVITFTSSSTVKHFVNLGIKLPQTCKIASIGPITTATLKACGMKPDIEASDHDIVGLTEAVRKLVG